MVVPTGLPAMPMKSNTKKWIKWLRIVQLILRALCMIGGAGLLAVMIILRGMEESIGWLMRIAVSIQCSVATSIYSYNLAWCRDATLFLWRLSPLS